MSRVLQPTTVTGSQAAPVPSFAGGGQVYDSGSLTIAGDSCYVQLLHGTQSQVNEDPYLRLAPGQYPLVGHDGDYLIGVNFAVDALATMACTVSGILYEPGKAGILSGSPSSVTTTPAGNAQLLTGQISAAGAVVAGSGFTSAQNATGDYTVTFTTAYSSVPTIVVSLFINANRAIRIYAQSAAAFSVITSDLSGVAQNCAFNFLAQATI